MATHRTIFVAALAGAVLAILHGAGSAASPPPDLTPPAVPTGLAAAPGDGSGVVLTWNANSESDLAGYNVYRHLPDETAWVLINNPVVAAPTYTDATVTGGTQYVYAVTAIDFAGNESDRSDSASVTAYAAPSPPPPPPGSPPPPPPPPADPPPDAVTGLRATADYTGITLSWDASAAVDLDHYVIYRAAAAAGPFFPRGGTNALSFLDDTASEGVPSFYRVTAIDVGGHESAGASVSATRPVTPQGDQVPISSKGTMSPATVHVHATPFGGQPYFRPTSPETPGISLAAGTPLEARYEWEFLESDGTTPNGVYPAVRGFNAAHQFINLTGSAQTFKIRLTITQVNGAKIVQMQSISVGPDKRAAIYVDAQAGNDAAAGTLAAPVRTIPIAMTKVTGPDKKILLAKSNAGYLYDIGSTQELRYNNTLIDVYTPAGRMGATIPIVRWNAPHRGVAFFKVTANDCTLQNFACDVTNRAIEGSAIYPRVVDTSRATNVTINGLRIDSASGILIQSTVNPPNGVFILSCTASDRALTGYGAYAQGANWVILGCQLYNVGTHCVRIAGVDNFLVHDCLLRRDSQVQEGLQGPRGTITAHIGRYCYFARNQLINGFLGVGPLDAGAGLDNPGARIKFVVIERNTNTGFDAGDGLNTGNQGGFQIKPGSENVILRNNVSIGIGKIHFEVQGYTAQYDRTVKDVWLINNTALDQSTNSKFLKAYDTTRLRLRNNLFHVPAGGIGVDVRGGMTAFASDAPADNQKPIDRNVWQDAGAAPLMAIASNGVNTSIAQWNAMSQVGDDTTHATGFQTQSGGANYRPQAADAAATYGRPHRGVWEDFYGVARGQAEANWAAGAAEA